VNALTLCAAILLASNSGELPLKHSQRKTACRVAGTIIAESEKAGVDPFVLAGLIYEESRFHTKAKSRAGACGLTQVLPVYAEVSCSELFDSRTSIRTGLSMLNRWRAYAIREGGDLREALSCYNAGTVCSENTRARWYANRVILAASKYRKIVASLEESISQR